MQARFEEGQEEKEYLYYLAACLLDTSDGRKLGLDPRLIDPSFEDNPDTKLNRCVENVARIHAETAEDRLTQIIFCDLGVPHKAAEAAVEGEDADDAKDKKSIAEVESLEEECDFCVYEQTLSNGYTLLILTSIRAFHRLQARYQGICNRSEYGEVCFYPSDGHRSQHTRSGQRTFPSSAQVHLHTVSDGK